MTLRLCGLALALPALVACQHNRIDYEPIEPAVLADFSSSPPPGLPPLPTAVAHPPAPAAFQTYQQGELTLHVDPRLREHHLLITATGQVLPQAKLVTASLNALARQQALTGDGCAEQLHIGASLHSLILSSRCDSPHALTLRARQLLAAMGAMDASTWDRVLRETRLAKHIEAFRGRDIDRLWAWVVLGETHPYLASDKAPSAEPDSMAADWRSFEAIASWQLLAPKPPVSGDWQAVTAPPQLSTDSSVSANKNTFNPSATDTRSPESTRVSDNTGKLLYLLDVPGQVQSQVRVGYSLPPASDAGQCIALAALLGRSHSGRLFYDLRSRRGLTYGVYGSCIDNPLSRTLKFYGASASESSAAFVRGILDHLALLAVTPPTAAELEALKTYLAGRQRLMNDTPGAPLTEWLAALERGQTQPKEPMESAAIDELRRQLLSRPPFVVIKGDADTLLPDLRRKLPDWQFRVLDRLP